MSNMPTSDDKFWITVKMLGTAMKLPIKRSDEQYVREAAQLLDKAYDKYARKSVENSFDLIACLKLVALEYGIKYQKLVAEKNELQKKLEQLEVDIDKALE